MQACSIAHVQFRCFGSRQNKFTIFGAHQLLIHFMMTIHKNVIKWMQKCSLSIISVDCLANFSGLFSIIDSFHSHASYRIWTSFFRKNPEEVEQGIEEGKWPHFFLIICVVIKSFSYIQMKFQIFNQDFFADIGNNALDIQTIADEVDSNTVCSYYVLILLWQFLCSKFNFFK